jgi:hypothetical protein
MYPASARSEPTAPMIKPITNPPAIYVSAMEGSDVWDGDNCSECTEHWATNGHQNSCLKDPC